MMKQLSLVSFVFLGACGVCGKMQSANAQLESKRQQCPNQPKSSFEASRCESNAKNCSENDMQRVDRFSTCIANLPSCTPETELQFSAQSLACTTDLIGVSLGCLAAVSGQ